MRSPAAFLRRRAALLGGLVLLASGLRAVEALIRAPAGLPGFA